MLRFYHLLLLAAATLTVAEPTVEARHAITPLAQVNGAGALPLFGLLKPRQNGCQGASETVCGDGNGCCPIGAACGYTTTGGSIYGICLGTCGAGAVTCTSPVAACCRAGERCGTDGTCTLAGNTAISTSRATAIASASATLSSVSASLSSASASRSSVQASLSSVASSVSASVSSVLSSASAAASSVRSSVASAASSAVASSSSGIGAQTIKVPGWMSIFSAIGMLFRLV